MKKVLPYLGASLSILAVSWSTAAVAQNNQAFTDVPPQHWAYEAVTSLQQKGIVVGYPGGYFPRQAHPHPLRVRRRPRSRSQTDPRW